MAELGFKDVIEQLKVNNRSEAGRDSTHTNEMRMSREANNQVLQNYKKQSLERDLPLLISLIINLVQVD